MVSGHQQHPLATSSLTRCLSADVCSSSPISWIAAISNCLFLLCVNVWHFQRTVSTRDQLEGQALPRDREHACVRDGPTDATVEAGVHIQTLDLLLMGALLNSQVFWNFGIALGYVLSKVVAH